MGNIVQPDTAIIDYTTIQSMITAIQDLQKAVSANPTAVTQMTIKGQSWVDAKETGFTINYASTPFVSAPVVVANIIHNTKAKVLPPSFYIDGKPTSSKAEIKFSKALTAGCWVSWIAVGTVSS